MGASISTTLNQQSAFAPPKIRPLENLKRPYGVCLLLSVLTMNGFSSGMNPILLEQQPKQSAFGTPTYLTLGQRGTGHEVRNKLKKIAALADGWCGTNSLAPTKKTIDNATTFFESLSPKLPAMKLSIANDGEVIFYSKTVTSYLEIGFYGNDQCSWYAKLSGKEYFEDDISVDATKENQLFTEILNSFV